MLNILRGNIKQACRSCIFIKLRFSVSAWKVVSSDSGVSSDSSFEPSDDEGKSSGDFPEDEGCVNEFSFDHQPALEGHPGPSPAVILQVSCPFHY